MSEVQKYVALGGMMPVDSGFGEGVYVKDHDFRIAQSQLAASESREMALLNSIEAANAQLAALREELASAVKDRETLLRLHVHLRARRSYWITEEGKAQQRLADAERRNAVLIKALTDTREALGREYWDQYAGLDETRDILDAALNPKPEAASHDE